MDTRIKGLWITALTSGDYEQGRQKLNRNGRFCCLGVLCEIAKEEGIVETDDSLPERGVLYKALGEEGEYDQERGLLPNAVMAWAGIETGSARFTRTNTFEGVEELSLVSLNDSMHYSFGEIAEVIAAHF